MLTVSKPCQDKLIFHLLLTGAFHIIIRRFYIEETSKFFEAVGANYFGEAHYHITRPGRIVLNTLSGVPDAHFSIPEIFGKE